MAVLGKERRSNIPRESSTRVIANAIGLSVDDGIFYPVIELQCSIRGKKSRREMKVALIRIKRLVPLVRLLKT